MSSQVVLITGTSGFVRRHLAKYLLELGYEVVGLDLEKGEDPIVSEVTVACDLLDTAALRRQISEISPDICVHLAARTDHDAEPSRIFIEF